MTALSEWATLRHVMEAPASISLMPVKKSTPDNSWLHCSVPRVGDAASDWHALISAMFGRSSVHNPTPVCPSPLSGH